MQSEMPLFATLTLFTHKCLHPPKCVCSFPPNFHRHPQSHYVVDCYGSFCGEKKKTDATSIEKNNFGGGGALLVPNRIGELVAKQTVGGGGGTTHEELCGFEGGEEMPR